MIKKKKSKLINWIEETTLRQLIYFLIEIIIIHDKNV